MARRPAAIVPLVTRVRLVGSARGLNFDALPVRLFQLSTRARVPIDEIYDTLRAATQLDHNSKRVVGAPSLARNTRTRDEQRDLM